MDVGTATKQFHGVPRKSRCKEYELAEADNGPPDRPTEPLAHRLPRSERLSAAVLLSLLGFLGRAGDRSRLRINAGIVRLLMEKEWEVQPARALSPHFPGWTALSGGSL